MKKILIVDDEPNNRMLLQEILEGFEAKGCELLYASDGTEALDIIIREEPDLVFLDVMLCEMDGLDVCRTAKCTMRHKSIFIAILTAKGLDADQKKVREAKADICLTKPFKVKAIIDIANRALGMGK